MNTKLLPITQSDAEIEAALEQASIPALMMSMIHMNGDTSLLDGPIKPQSAEMLDVQGGMPEDDKATIRAQAFEVIRRYRDGGCTPAPLPDEGTIDRMMQFLIGGEPVPEELRPLLLEELAIDGEDARRFKVDPTALQKAKDFRVVIVGAGMSGLLLAIRLKQAGVPFTILEKNEGVGGTWFENRYPGCRVDIASHNYSYSFDPGEWQHYFGQHDEVRDYFARIARDYDLLSSIVFGAEVSGAKFSEEDSRWTLSYLRNGASHSIDGNVLVSAVGQLNRPKTPDVQGSASFSGPQMHTAEWDASVDLSGKRVAVVGTGASAFQLVPELAKTAGQITVFQRTPSWMMPNPGYHDAITPEVQWCLRSLPGYARWYRLLSFWPMADKAHTRTQIDPTWDDGGLSCSADNQAMRVGLSAWIESQVHTPGLLEKVVPNYPPFGTRTLQDNGSWLSALQRDDVELVSSHVEQVTPKSVIAHDGSEHEVDAIVWATGFHADRFLWPMEIEGRDGALLSKEWEEAPKAHLGLTLPKFPNLFCLYGPNTNVAHTGNVIFVSECQANYILDGIRMLLEEGVESIECEEGVADAYEERLSEALDRSVWAHPQVRSFYQNATGRVVVNMPWRISEYWAWTQSIDPAEYRLKRSS